MLQKKKWPVGRRSRFFFLNGARAMRCRVGSSHTRVHNFLACWSYFCTFAAKRFCFSTWPCHPLTTNKKNFICDQVKLVIFSENKTKGNEIEPRRCSLLIVTKWMKSVACVKLVPRDRLCRDLYPSSHLFFVVCRRIRKKIVFFFFYLSLSYSLSIDRFNSHFFPLFFFSSDVRFRLS